MISICSLIYKSKIYADAVYQSLYKYTPMLQNGRAEFYFVANDPTEELLQHLQIKGYRYYLNINPKRTEQELFNLGYGCPEYIHRVYRGWNVAIQKADEVVVLVNSDNLFSPNWLENLLKWSAKNIFVCSKIVERNHPKYGAFPGALAADFGKHPSTFKEVDFLKFCSAKAIFGSIPGGAYMPCLFFKETVERVGLYPEGNLSGEEFKRIRAYGDEEFVRKLSQIGVRHITSLDSIVYHFKEGEMDE